jgi:hypothetical protein
MPIRCFASVSEVCCKCFSYFGCILQMFSYRYCKSKSGVALAHIATRSVCHNCLLQLLGRRAYAWGAEGDEGRGVGVPVRDAEGDEDWRAALRECGHVKHMGHACADKGSCMRGATCNLEQHTPAYGCGRPSGRC